MDIATILTNDISKEHSYNALVEPIYMTTTYKQSIGEKNKYLYTASGNPNFDSLEYKLNKLEKGAKETVVFPTGMAAIGSVMLSILKAGDEIICNDSTYMVTTTIINTYLGKFGVMNKFLDLRNICLLEKTITKKTKMIWIETPSNPLLRFYDIQEIVKKAKKYGSIVCVDSTFLSSLNISPLELGADIVVQSTTKYIGGTADVMGGVVSTNNIILAKKIRKTRNTFGLLPSPFNCWLLERSLKTFSLRMERIENNALYIAKELEQKTFVEQVIYPGLPSFDQFKLARRQTSGSGGVIGVRVNYNMEKIKQALKKIHLRKPAVSFGGTESLIDYTACIGGTDLPREKMNIIGDKFLRLSVGVEDKEDLINDFIQAFRS